MGPQDMRPLGCDSGVREPQSHQGPDVPLATTWPHLCGLRALSQGTLQLHNTTEAGEAKDQQKVPAKAPMWPDLLELHHKV